MLSFLPTPVLGMITLLLLFINIMLLALLVILVGLIKALIPSSFHRPRSYLSQVQIVLACFWVDINSFIISLAAKVTWEITGQGTLNVNHWYFVLANHQSWADILILGKVFNRKIPLLKFFMKQELLWSLPMGGLACWMLDFPFMKRYSKAKLKKNPSLKVKDLEVTKKACNKFKIRPTAVVNFLEGTRFTKEKRLHRCSPYQNLLRPKAGGLAFVANELKDSLKEIIDVTIIYNHPHPSFWKLLCGKIKKVTVYYDVVPLELNQYGNYYADLSFRKNFQGWINDRWHAKDHLMSQTTATQNIL